MQEDISKLTNLTHRPPQPQISAGFDGKIIADIIGKAASMRAPTTTIYQYHQDPAKSDKVKKTPSEGQRRNAPPHNQTCSTQKRNNRLNRKKHTKEREKTRKDNLTEDNASPDSRIRSKNPKHSEVRQTPIAPTRPHKVTQTGNKDTPERTWQGCSDKSSNLTQLVDERASLPQGHPGNQNKINLEDKQTPLVMITCEPQKKPAKSKNNADDGTIRESHSQANTQHMTDKMTQDQTENVVMVTCEPQKKSDKSKNNADDGTIRESHSQANTQHMTDKMTQDQTENVADTQSTTHKMKRQVQKENEDNSPLSERDNKLGSSKKENKLGNKLIALVEDEQETTSTPRTVYPLKPPPEIDKWLDEAISRLRRYEECPETEDLILDMDFSKDL
jgi:hypothetical protein